MEELTAFQRDILYVVAGSDEEKPHGLAIKDGLADYRLEKINHGRLYPNLDTLVEKGLLSKGQLDRRTNWYGLTRRGRREIDARHEWMNEQVAEADIVDVDPVESEEAPSEQVREPTDEELQELADGGGETAEADAEDVDEETVDSVIETADGDDLDEALNDDIVDTSDDSEDSDD